MEVSGQINGKTSYRAQTITDLCLELLNIVLFLFYIVIFILIELHVLES